MTKISVIMPVYNGEKFIENTVNMILNQSMKDFELILVNDGSLDQSALICDEIAKKDLRIKVIHQKNQGICGARNTGLKNATGEYIAFADQDDDCLPGWLEDNYKVAKKYSADLVKSGRIAETVDEKGTVIKKDIRELEKRFYNRQEVIENFYALRDKNVFSPVWDGLFRNEIIKMHDIHFRKEFKQGEEDTAFCLEFLVHTERFATNSGVYFKHYERYATSTSSVFNMESLNGLVRCAVIEEQVKETLGLDNKTASAGISSAKHHLIPIMVQLQHRNCKWSMKKKREYIEHLHEIPAFRYDYDRKVFREIWNRDKKKAIVLYIFEAKHDGMIVILAKVYNWLLRRKLKATVHKYD